VQETYARAIAKVDRIPSVKAIKPTLYKILHNLFVDQWRAEQRAPLMISADLMDDQGQSTVPLVCPSGSPRDQLIRNAFSDEVEMALDDLDDAWRETLWLREIEGYSYEEISATTRVPVGTVRSRLARARRRMADKLETFAAERGIGPKAGVKRSRGGR